MSRFININNYSLGTKIVFALIIFIFFFLLIKFSLVIPKTQKEAYNNEINNISDNLFFIKEQMKMAVKSIRNQKKQELSYLKQKIALEVNKLPKNTKDLNTNELVEYLNRSEFANYCSYSLFENAINYKSINGKDLFDKNDKNVVDKWITFEKEDEKQILQRKKIYFFYNTYLVENRFLSIGCHIRKLNPNHSVFEENLRVNIQRSLEKIQSADTAKNIILWLNQDLKYDDKTPLFNEKQDLVSKKYKISNLSNTQKLTTSKLTAKQIVENIDKAPLEYVLNGKEVVTWIVNLNIKSSSNLYLMIYTINKDEIINKANKNLFVLLPETLIAICFAFILILLIFRKLLRKVNIVINTAKKVNEGNIKVRTKVAGSDDIGQLGIVFDSMLDFFEHSIRVLDSKVDEKTKELKKSLKEKQYLLEEKETLLKEIHHRVKNNLAKTITFIELQENDIADESTKKALHDIKERVYTMELLHRKLYESTNLNEIPLDEYLIDLVDSIASAYSNKNSVIVEYDIEKIDLNIETAMPLGLIINELVTNSFKYAFFNNQNPKLKIEFSKKKSFFTLSIKDNGTGLNKEFLSSPTTLGLKLINTIVRFQLQGKIDYKYENGAKFIIEAHIKELSSPT